MYFVETRNLQYNSKCRFGAVLAIWTLVPPWRSIRPDLPSHHHYSSHRKKPSTDDGNDDDDGHDDDGHDDDGHDDDYDDHHCSRNHKKPSTPSVSS